MKTFIQYLVLALVAIFTLVQPSTAAEKASAMTDPVGFMTTKTMHEGWFYTIKAQWISHNFKQPDDFVSVLFEVKITEKGANIIEDGVVVFNSVKIPPLKEGWYLMKKEGKLFATNPKTGEVELIPGKAK